MNPNPTRPARTYPIIVVQGCARTNCDCEVHFRDRNFDRNFNLRDGKLSPTEFPRVYREIGRDRAVEDYRRRHPKALKVIAATV